MKFTFKTEKPSGKYKSFYPSAHYIKLKKKVVGEITDSNPHKIRLAVFKDDVMEDGNPNCLWKWVRLKNAFEDVEAAKTFLNANIKIILDRFNLALLED